MSGVPAFPPLVSELVLLPVLDLQEDDERSDQ
jgi:hypothetical protein